MKKLIYLVVLLLSSSIYAQIPNGSIAPNFTETDLNGNTHELYAYLDSGYTVYLDLSATWCGPCWNYHQTGAFEDLYNNYGPSGSNEVRVLWIEADPGTSIDDIYGLGNQTNGDWTEGVNFPMIDDTDGSVADAYQLGYYPTIWMICPDRTITEVGQIDGEQLYQSHNNCAVISEGLNAAIREYSGDINTDCNGYVDASITIQNLGSEEITEISGIYAIGDDNQILAQTSFTGSLLPYEMTTVDFGEQLQISGDSLFFVLWSGDGDANPADDVYSTGVNLAINDANPNITINITTDAFGSETTWELVGDDALIYASGGPYNDLGSAGTTVQESINLYLSNQEVCYTFTIYDAYGDGINTEYYGEGSYSIVDGNGTILASGGVFTSSEAIVFGVTEGNGVTPVEPCVLDPSLENMNYGMWPDTIQNLPEANVGEYYQTSLQIKTPTLVGDIMGYPYYIDVFNNSIDVSNNSVDSIQIIDVSNLPSVMSIDFSEEDGVVNEGVYLGNSVACMDMYGTPTMIPFKK